jgi:hypothetical protein
MIAPLIVEFAGNQRVGSEQRSGGRDRNGADEESVPPQTTPPGQQHERQDKWSDWRLGVGGDAEQDSRQNIRAAARQ